MSVYMFTGPSPADNDEELDEEQRVRDAAALLRGCGEVQRTVPQLGAEEHQDLPGKQGHLRAALLQPGRFREGDVRRDVKKRGGGEGTQ